MKWAVEAGLGSTAHTSRNMIKGINTLCSDIKNGFEAYNEHWLMPDGGDIMTMKARDLADATGVSGNQQPTLTGPASQYWLLQPRESNKITLSAILQYLAFKKFPNQDFEVCWTCCRSPIGLPPTQKMAYQPATNTYKKQAVDEKESGYTVSDPREGRGEGSWDKTIRHIVADGTITLMCATDQGLRLAASWPGINGVKEPLDRSPAPAYNPRRR
jgi:hypothetical protein